MLVVLHAKCAQPLGVIELQLRHQLCDICARIVGTLGEGGGIVEEQARRGGVGRRAT